ncbi:MAG: hypothetical protein M5U31_12055 [Acidimicrobiia bacterium]|nr:hypothetical protein [Acidimicrobiia bacterium]
MSRKSTAAPSTGDDPVNLAVLRGECSGPAEVRVLESGTRLASLAVRVPAGETATSVPVTVWDPSTAVESLSEGDPVTVVGRVRRRFYRQGGATGSRVDVEAERIVTGSDKRRRAAARRFAESALAHLDA